MPHFLPTSGPVAVFSAAVVIPDAILSATRHAWLFDGCSDARRPFRPGLLQICGFGMTPCACACARRVRAHRTSSQNALAEPNPRPRVLQSKVCVLRAFLCFLLCLNPPIVSLSAAPESTINANHAVQRSQDTDSGVLVLLSPTMTAFISPRSQAPGAWRRVSQYMRAGSLAEIRQAGCRAVKRPACLLVLK